MELWEHIIDTSMTHYPKSISIETLTTHWNPHEVSFELKNLMESHFPFVIIKDNISLAFPLLSKKKVTQHLQTKCMGKNLTVFKEIGSTNTYAKNHLTQLTHGEVVLAHEQVTGKGRLGRSWSSPAGKSLSMTWVLKPSQTIPDANLLTQLTAAALVKTLEDVAAPIEIKWPNDVLLNKKKIAGILTEAEFSGNELVGIVIGMGVNTNLENKDFSEDLLKKASSLRNELKKVVDPNELIAAFLWYFETFYNGYIEENDTESFLTICRQYSALIGKEFWLHEKEEKRKILVKSIDEHGGLVIKDLATNQLETLTSTHYSIRGKNGYI